LKPVRFLQEARDELLEQGAFSEAQQKGLGAQFQESVAAALALNRRSAWSLRLPTSGVGRPIGVAVSNAVTGRIKREPVRLHHHVSRLRECPL
jgi:hypothetical protein